MMRLHLYAVAALLAVCSLTDSSRAAENTLSRVELKRAATQIDQAVQQGLTKKKIQPNPRIDDLTFLRRIYLDTVGRIPNLKERQSFWNPRKRDRDALIADLVNRPTYPSHQFNYWTDVLRAQSRNGQNYLNYIRNSLRENKPYDKFVYEMLSSEGSPHQIGNGAVGYLFRDRRMPLDNLSLTTQVFLGLDMSCAQCHDDPFSEWTQMDFYQLSAYYYGIRYAGEWSRWKQVLKEIKKQPELKDTRIKEFRLFMGFRILGNGKGFTPLPYDYQYDDGKPYEYVPARVLFGKQPDVKVDVASIPKWQTKFRAHGGVGDNIGARKKLAAWITSRDNEMFVKTITNRMWHKIMGVPLIGPLTNLTQRDLGPNPVLTHTLMDIMLDVDFDLRAFEQIVFMTQTYQSDVSRGDIEGTDKYLFQGPAMKRLTHSQLWDSLQLLYRENLDDGYVMRETLTPEMVFYECLKTMEPKDIATMLVERKRKGGNGKFFGQVMMAHWNKVTDYKKGRPPQVMSQGSMAGMMGPGMLTASQTRPQNSRASELPVPHHSTSFLRQFGQSERLTVDSDHTETSVTQALNIMNGIAEDLAAERTASLVMRVREAKTDEQKIRTAYALILTRGPTAAEVALFKSQLRDNGGQFRHMIWTLLNTNEFKFRR